MSQELNILYHNQVSLMDWGESRAGGKWIKLKLWDEGEDDPLSVFRGMDTATAKHTGHILNVTISQGDILPADDKQPDPPEASSPQKTPYGKEARELYQSSFFRTPKVWAAVGSPMDYRAWVQKQPCCVCGSEGEHDMETGEHRCHAAHVRRAGESGTGFKADYAEVPMCYECHVLLQHQHGETRAYRRHIMLKTGHEQLVTEDHAKNWFSQQRINYVHRWCWETLKARLGNGYVSWSTVPPHVLQEWADLHGLGDIP